MNKTQSERLNGQTFDYEVKHIGLMEDNDNGHKWPHDLWLVTINGQRIDYKTGIGLREKSKFPKDSWKYRVDTPKAPKIDDIIYSLLTDWQVSKDSFEEFCANCGYDTDSRKGLDIYLACQDSGQKLLKIGINLEQAQTAFENY